MGGDRTRRISPPAEASVPAIAPAQWPSPLKTLHRSVLTPTVVGAVAKGYEDGLAAFERMTSLMLSVPRDKGSEDLACLPGTSLERR